MLPSLFPLFLLVDASRVLSCATAHLCNLTFMQPKSLYFNYSKMGYATFVALKLTKKSMIKMILWVGMPCSAWV
jgi:hypothetical protein